LPPPALEALAQWARLGFPWPETAGTPSPAAAPDWKTHWAFQPLGNPQPPAVQPITVQPIAAEGADWCRTPIDAFVLARLQAAGITPAPPADRPTLLRRVWFDLLGLPPGANELESFAADPAPDALERVVDRLLASPHYGERWARVWLDLARYADSNGYEKDRLRAMWKYRDWVIDALNQDMPFDRFTIEQIAGDMLPGATDGQKIASGFHRNTMLNQEGGIDVEEARWETIIDRVNTTGTVWLGSTIGCAQCHNHKYDPFTQQDYYRLFAFFDNVEYSVAGRPGSDRWIAEPELDLPTPDQDARRRLLTSKIERLNDGIKASVAAGDNGSRELMEKILLDEEHHIDWLEGQLHAIEEMTYENYLAQQLHQPEES